MTLTIRERALRQLKANFEAMQNGSPASDPYTITWSLVTRQDPSDRVRGKRYVLGVFDTTESKTPRVGQMEATLQVVLQWWAYIDREDDPSEEGNRIIGEIQRKLREDIYLNDGNENLVLNVVETGNDLNIDTDLDRTIEGAVFVNVLYKHSEDDPRSYV